MPRLLGAGHNNLGETRHYSTDLPECFEYNFYEASDPQEFRARWENLETILHEQLGVI